MKYPDTKRVVWTGLASVVSLTAAPLACSSSPDNSSPSSGGIGNPGAGTQGVAGSSVGGAPSGGASSGGASSGGAPSGMGGGGGRGHGHGGSSATGGASGAGASGAPATGSFDGSHCSYANDKDFCACIGATCGGDTLNDLSGNPQSIYCGQCAGAQTCVGFASPAGGALGTCQDLGGLTDAQKAQAAALTSVWENSTPTLDYAYAEDTQLRVTMQAYSPQRVVSRQNRRNLSGLARKGDDATARAALASAGHRGVTSRGVPSRSNSLSVAAGGLGRAEISPLNGPVGDAEARVREALDVDELVGAAFVLRAATAAIRVCAFVEHRDDDRLRAGFQTQIVQRQLLQIREHGDDVVRLNPSFRFCLVAGGKLALVQAAAVLDALFAARIGVGGEVRLVRALPGEARGCAAGPGRTSRAA